MADFEEEPIVEENLAIEESSDAKEVKLFGRWKFDEIEVRDMSLVVSINMIIFILAYLLVHMVHNISNLHSLNN